MNKVIKNSFLILALLSVMFTSCKKEYENPPINDVPFGDTLTIGDILSMAPNTVFDTASVCGIVTADEQSGNLYKAIFIQDPGTGKAIQLKLNASSAARIGDSVRVCLDPSIMYYSYNGLPQLTDTKGNGFSPDGHLVIYPYNKPIEPKVVTIADIRTGQYVGALVKLKNVEFPEKNVTFCEVGETTNRLLIDSTYTAANVKEFCVRTSNYANFAYDYMPVSKGDLVAIASIYSTSSTTHQLILRSKTEMDFAVWGGPAAPGGELQNMPYSQSFTADFGTYTTYSVDGPQVWSIEYSTAKMSGYENNTNYANEDWLISSPVAITGVDKAKVAVTYCAQYKNSDPNDVTLQISTDYVYGDDPTKATWTQMPDAYPNTSSWSDFKTVETSLNDFIGQNITVAIKFTSTDSQSRTMEIQSIAIEEGEAGGGGGGVTPGGEGSGTAEDPYNVAAGINAQNQNTAWVHGYIVGAVKEGSDHNTVSSNDDIDWAAPFGRATNVLIADDASCHDIANCLIVKMPSGSALRSQVNLKDHPENLGKHLAVSGTLKNAFGKPGVDSPGTESDFVFEGGGTPTPPGNTIFSETFSNGIGVFAIKDVVKPSEITDIWVHDNSYHCMKATGHVGSASGPNYDTESWLVSPSISLADVSAATLKFDQAVNYLAPNGYLFVMVSTNYSGSVGDADWTELTISSWPAGNNWSFVSSSADLTSFAGQSVTIAFKFTSSTSASATWEVKNVVVE